MNDYVTLLGAEDVARAARTISNAAETLRGSASEITHAAENMHRATERLNDVLSANLEHFERLVIRMERIARGEIGPKYEPGPKGGPR